MAAILSQPQCGHAERDMEYNNSGFGSEDIWDFIEAVHGIINTLRPRQNGCRFADDTFKCIFLNENVRISIKISLKFVPKGPINNNPALVLIMAWCRSDASHYLNQWWLDYQRIYASLGLNELKHHDDWTDEAHLTCPANERYCYIVTMSLIGWAHT